MSFSTEDGLVDREILGMFPHMPASYPNGAIMFPVRLLLNNGESEIGFKEVEKKDVDTGKRELVSYFIKDKIQHPKTGKWEYLTTLYGGSYPSPELISKMCMYNGDEDCIGQRKLDSVTYYLMTEWLDGKIGRGEFSISTIVNSHWGEISLGKEWKPHYSKPPDGYEKWKDMTPVFFAYVRRRYLKSIYRKVTRRKSICKLFRLDDLISISIVDGDSDGNEEPRIIWSSIDALTHLGLYK
jgi:hypothetical protein